MAPTIDQVFNIAPQFVFEVTDQYGTISTKFEHGIIQRRAIFTEKNRFFSLQWNTIIIGTRDLIRTFFINAQGGNLDLKWTPPNESSQIRVKFVEDSFEWSRVTGINYNISFVFREVFRGNFF